MFHVLTITYEKPPEFVDRVRPAHVDWVRAHVDAGRLILAGRLEAGDGGILITSDLDADEVDGMVADDPYCLAGVASYGRVSFQATLRGGGL